MAQCPCTDFTLSMISKEVLQREKAIGKSLLVIRFLPWEQGDPGICAKGAGRLGAGM